MRNAKILPELASAGILTLTNLTIYNIITEKEFDMKNNKNKKLVYGITSSVAIFILILLLIYTLYILFNLNPCGTFIFLIILTIFKWNEAQANVLMYCVCVKYLRHSLKNKQVKNKSNILNNEMLTVIKSKVQSLVKMKIEVELTIE